MRLVSGLLFEGSILCIDSYYTSVPLIEEFFKNMFCDTVKVNKKCLPSQAKENRNMVK